MTYSVACLPATTCCLPGTRAFLTAEALTSISQTTLQNLSNLEKGETCPNELV